MAEIGDRVRYTVADNHVTKTVVAGAEKLGSVFHPDHGVFAGMIGAVREGVPDEATGKLSAPSYDVVIFPPNRAPVWVRAEEGEGAGEFIIVKDVPPSMFEKLFGQQAQ